MMSKKVRVEAHFKVFSDMAAELQKQDPSLKIYDELKCVDAATLTVDKNCPEKTKSALVKTLENFQQFLNAGK